MRPEECALLCRPSVPDQDFRPEPLRQQHQDAILLAVEAFDLEERGFLWVLRECNGVWNIFAPSSVRQRQSVQTHLTYDFAKRGERPVRST